MKNIISFLRGSPPAHANYRLEAEDGDTGEATTTSQAPQPRRTPDAQNNGNSSLLQRDTVIEQPLANRTKAEVKSASKKMDKAIPKLFEAMASRDLKKIAQFSAKITKTLADSPNPSVELRKHLTRKLESLGDIDAIRKLAVQLPELEVVNKDPVLHHLRFLVSAQLLINDAMNLIASGYVSAESLPMMAKYPDDKPHKTAEEHEKYQELMAAEPFIGQVKLRASQLLLASPFLSTADVPLEIVYQENALKKFRDILFLDHDFRGTKNTELLSRAGPLKASDAFAANEMAIRQNTAKLEMAQAIETLLQQHSDNDIPTVLLSAVLVAQKSIKTLSDLGDKVALDTVITDIMSAMQSPRPSLTNLLALKQSLDSGGGAALRRVAQAPENYGVDTATAAQHQETLALIVSFINVLQDAMNDRLGVSPSSSARSTGNVQITPAVQSAYDQLLTIKVTKN